jgi:hypothetical protein
VAAARLAAGAALEVIGRGEDEILPFEVIVFRIEPGLCGAGWSAVHASIFS